MDKTPGKNTTVQSIVVIAVIVVVIAITLVIYTIVSSGSTGARLAVHDGDGAVTEISLSQDSVNEITTSLGTNVVCVEGGEAYVSQADCKNHDCMEQGRISSPGQQIVCLPHRLWIEVLVAGDEAGSNSVEDVANSYEYDTVAR